MFLVVDDEAEIRETLTELFGFYGYSGRTAENGLQALEKLSSRAGLPKLILLDLAMPVLDGCGFLLERSKVPRLLYVPVIIVSATPGIEARAWAAGAHSVLRKPVALSALLSAAEPFLKN